MEKPEVIAMAAMLILALVIVVLNDWTKRAAVRRAEVQNQQPRARYLNNKTNWGFLVIFCALSGMYFYLRINNEWVDDYHGPFEPLVRWHFADTPDPNPEDL